LFCSSFVASYSEGPEDPPSQADPHAELGEREIKRIEADTYCSINSPYVWCLPRDYNRAKHPFICKYKNQIMSQTYIELSACFLVSHLINKSLPWSYDFEFIVEEISNINDKAQVIQTFCFPFQPQAISSQSLFFLRNPRLLRPP